MTDLLLQVSPREEVGKSVARRLRREGKIPGNYYHHGKDARSLAVDKHNFKAVVAAESSVIRLDFGDGKKLPTIIKEIQFDPMTSEPLHVDFLGVKLDEKVIVEVPINLVGTAKGVKTHGGILQTLLRQVEVECLPLEIPETIDIDISDLDVHDSITVNQLTHEKVVFVTDPDTVIASCLPPRIEAEEEVVEEEAAEEAGEPEVVGKGKKEDEAAESEN